MQEMKSSKEKKRKHTHRESEARRRKKRSAESSVKDPKEEEAEPTEEVEEEPSDIEEEGLNLNVPFKAISAYLSDRQEMLEQCFHVLGQKKLIKMLPDELKNCSLAEIKALCWDQLQQLSETNLLQILEGKEVTANSEAEEQGTKRTADSQQDNNVDSTSSVKESAEAEDKQEGLSGEESDVLSINANMDDSDIEGHRDPKPQQQEVPATAAPPPSTQTPPAASPLKPDLESEEPKLELQRDIDKSVSEILALTVPTPTDTDPLQPAAGSAIPASLPVSVAVPSAQQLALLELEMRARAIKALMKASEVKK